MALMVGADPSLNTIGGLPGLMNWRMSKIVGFPESVISGFWAVLTGDPHSGFDDIQLPRRVLTLWQ